LVRDGFTGVIHATAATRDLCAVMLADSAHIQMEDANWLNKKRRKDGMPEITPLYDDRTAVQTIRQFQTSPYGRWFKAASGIHARFFDAGHMLGSAGIEIEITEQDGRKQTIVFTGDVGRPGIPIIRDPAPLPEYDYLICEATYGGRTSEPVGDMKPRLAEIVRRTVDHGGRVLIPAFSVGRTQTIVYHLRDLFSSGQLKPVPVFIDSPLAINATEVFRLHPDCYDVDARELSGDGNGLLDGRSFHYVQSRQESKKITRRRAPCIVIAASGMCEAGRILHHLTHAVTQAKNTILIVGYQAEHTLGRRLVERESHVNIYQQRLPLNAEVAVLNGFSSHADARELRQHARSGVKRCKRVFLVHAEYEQSSALAGALVADGHRAVEVPSMGDTFQLD
jgi:metallo-beta-lactamase family protein